MADRLYRSRTDRVLFGVAGGVAERLGVDPALVRIAWILLTLAWGFGFILYVVMAFVVPEVPEAPESQAGVATGEVAGAAGGAPVARRHDDGRGALLFGLILVLVGAWFLARQWLPFLDTDLLWPVVLIAIGAVLVLGAIRRSS